MCVADRTLRLFAAARAWRDWGRRDAFLRKVRCGTPVMIGIVPECSFTSVPLDCTTQQRGDRDLLLV